MRGYGYQRLGPFDPNGDPVGGRSLAEFSIEARYRFGDYGIVPFVDAGNSYESSYPTLSSLKLGAGIGGRFYTNFGPLRVDVATPLNRRKGDGRIALYISIGQSFLMPRWQSVAKWAGIALAAIVVLLGLILLGLNTAPGRRLVADQIGAYKTESGLNFRVGRIDGSIYGKMILRDLRVADPKGVFLTAPTIAVDWNPFHYVSNHIDVRSVAAPLVTMTRTAQLNQTPSDPNAPLLPDLDIDIDRLTVDRVILGPAVTGSKRVLRIAGAAHIATAARNSTPVSRRCRGLA